MTFFLLRVLKIKIDLLDFLRKCSIECQQQKPAQLDCLFSSERVKRVSRTEENRPKLTNIARSVMETLFRQSFYYFGSVRHTLRSGNRDGT